jgi:hypothetical protein
MSSTPQQPNEKDPVDALAELAGGQELEDQPAMAQDLDPLAALNRLANGQDAADPPPPPPLPPTPSDQYARADEHAPPPAAAPAPVRPVSVRTRNTIEAKAIAHSYKKTMIPLLLLVGVLLVIIGGVCIYIYTDAQPEFRGNSYHKTVLLLAVLSLPLAVVMFLGAWWFHHETSGRT